MSTMKLKLFLLILAHVLQPGLADSSTIGASVVDIETVGAIASLVDSANSILLPLA